VPGVRGEGVTRRSAMADGSARVAQSTPRRAEKVCKWTSTALFVLVLAAWLTSAYGALGWASATGGVFFADGLFGIVRDSVDTSERGWLFLEESEGMLWWYFHWGVDKPGPRSVYAFPAWILVALAGGTSAVMWVRGWEGRTAKRRRLGVCARCAYSRAGLAEGAACPECGGKA
jgi:hypothetical protein